MARFLDSRRLQGLYDEEYVPIIAERAPTTKDTADIGSCWIDKPNDDVYFLTSTASNSATWINAGGGTGTFNALTVTTTATIGTTLTVSGLTAGTVRSSAAGLFSVLADGADGTVMIGTTAGVPAWATLTAGGGITITEAAGAITITNPGATGTTMTASDANAVAPDGLGNTDVIGYDTNITTDGAVANTLKVRLADDIVSVASITATNDLDMTAGTCTITSDDNAANAIYLHTDAGVNEQIHIHVDQGTAVNSITIESDVGGLVIASDMASADAININASNAAGGIDVDYGTNGMTVDGANGAFTLQTGTANILIGVDVADHDITLGDDSGVNAMTLVSGTDGLVVTSTGAILFDSTGVIELNSDGIIGIGNDAIAQNINLGTGAAARTITIGNTSAASSTIIDVGTGSLDLGVSATAHLTRLGSTNTTSATTVQSGSGAMTFTAGGAFNVDAVAALTIDSDSTIAVGSAVDNQAITIGAGGERTVTIGGTTTASSVVVQVGTGPAYFGANATVHATVAGSITGASPTTVQAGTGDFVVTAGGILDINGTGDLTIDVSAGIFDVSVSGNVTLDSSAGTIGIGVDDIDQAINIGTNGERVITIGNQVGVAGMTIESGSAGMALNGLGLTTIELLEDTQAAAAVTVNGNNGAGVFTGLTTAAAASQIFTITNSICTVNSRILATVANKGANDAQMTKTRLVPGAGSFTVTAQNFGAAALNGDVIITFFIMKA